MQVTVEGSVLVKSVCVFFLFVYEISLQPLNGFVPNSHRSRVSTLAWTTLKVDVKGERLRSPGTKNSIFRPFSSLRAVYVW